jgi:hypothetical protein
VPGQDRFHRVLSVDVSTQVGRLHLACYVFKHNIPSFHIVTLTSNDGTFQSSCRMCINALRFSD